MRVFTATTFSLVFFLAFPALGGSIRQRPGHWQIRKQLEVPGVPADMPPVTFDVCLTKEALEDPERTVPSDPKANCAIRDYRIEGGTARWRLDCPSSKMTGTGEISYGDTSYKGALRMQLDHGQRLIIKYTGKWLGECSN